MFKVLAVDDEPRFVEETLPEDILYPWIKRNEIEYGHADGPETGLEKVEEFQPDIILLDNKMPNDDDGKRFLGKLRDDGNEVPVIMVTGYDDLNEFVRPAIKLGVVDYVSKPLKGPETIEGALTHSFGVARLHQDINYVDSLLDRLESARTSLSEDQYLAHVVKIMEESVNYFATRGVILNFLDLTEDKDIIRHIKNHPCVKPFVNLGDGSNLIKGRINAVQIGNGRVNIEQMLRLQEPTAFLGKNQTVFNEDGSGGAFLYDDGVFMAFYSEEKQRILEKKIASLASIIRSAFSTYSFVKTASASAKGDILAAVQTKEKLPEKPKKAETGHYVDVDDIETQSHINWMAQYILGRASLEAEKGVKHDTLEHVLNNAIRRAKVHIIDREFDVNLFDDRKKGDISTIPILEPILKSYGSDMINNSKHLKDALGCFMKFFYFANRTSDEKAPVRTEVIDKKDGDYVIQIKSEGPAIPRDIMLLMLKEPEKCVNYQGLADYYEAFLNLAVAKRMVKNDFKGVLKYECGIELDQQEKLDLPDSFDRSMKRYPVQYLSQEDRFKFFNKEAETIEDFLAENKLTKQQKEYCIIEIRIPSKIKIEEAS